MTYNFKFCKRCLYSTSHPLGLTLDVNGICSGCRIHEEKNRLNWDDRWKTLEQLVKQYRSRTKGTYDCIVPVTGGQDSYYTVFLVKERLGLNPLLVAYNKYFNTQLGIHNLANLRIRFNCDIIFQNINPNSVKKITRSTLRRLGSIYWPILAGHSVFPVQTAIRYKVPLIVWPAHQGTEQVGMFSYEHEIEMTRRYRKNHDLMGFEADDLLDIFDTVNEVDIWQYRYPDDYDLDRIGVRGIYLANYVRWDQKAQHEEMIRRYKYRTALFSRTFDCYDYVDCFNYMSLHDELKLYKHGYSKVTDHACREIRFGRISREMGVALVRCYERRRAEHRTLLLEWLGMKEESLDFVLNQHRNKVFWKRSKFNEWQFCGLSTQPDFCGGGQEAESQFEKQFIVNSTLEHDGKASYVTIGKGFP